MTDSIVRTSRLHGGACSVLALWLCATAPAACSDPRCGDDEVQVGTACLSRPNRPDGGTRARDPETGEVRTPRDAAVGDDIDASGRGDASTELTGDADGDWNDLAVDAADVGASDAGAAVDGDAPQSSDSGTHPGCVPTTEVCNEKDDDCDGQIDEGDPPCKLTIASIAAGMSSTCVVLSDGTAQCWGANRYGQLGDQTNQETNRPVIVRDVTNIAQIAVGDSHTCALLRDGTVRCWGYNYWGQLGNGTTKDSFTPATVSGLGSAVQIAASMTTTCAVLADGTVKCWGDESSLVPKPYVGLSGVAKLALAKNGANSGCAQLKSGQVTCWEGDQSTVEAGISDAVDIAVGVAHACAALKTGIVTCWNRSSDPANDELAAITGAQYVTGAVSVGAGLVYSCAVLGGRTVRCWGDNTLGNLGTGKDNAYLVIRGLSASALAAGGTQTCALTEAGTVTCWGTGFLGDGFIGNNTQYAPIPVMGIP